MGARESFESSEAQFDKDEAADVLIEAYDGTAANKQARQATKRKDALLAGDSHMIRAMLLTGPRKNEQTPAEYKRP